MATDQERLLLLLEAQTKQFERAITQAESKADLGAAKIERRFNQMNQKITRDFNKFASDARTALAALGVGLVVNDVVSLADSWTTVGNRLAFAGVQSERLAETQQLVADIASRTRSDLDATADLFARMFRASEDLGASQERVLRVTEIVSKALAGASQSERQGAIRQLGQGLASGRLQGDELRSILENSRPIAEAIATEFNTTVGNLRKLGAAGVLESRRVFEAIERAGADIDQAFSQTSFTVADSFTRLRTEAARFIGTNEATSGSVRALTGLIDAVAGNFELLADAVVITATVIGGAFAGTAVSRAIIALNAMIGSMTTATTRAAALQRGLAFFGGPLGIALTVAGGAMAYLATQTDIFASKAQTLDRAEDSLYSALQLIAGLETASEGAATETGRVADEANRAATELDQLGVDAADAAEGLSVQEQAARDLAEAEKERAIATIQSAIADRESAIALERRDRVFRRIAGALDAERASIREGLGLPSDQELDQQGEAEIRRHEQRIEFLQGVADRLESGELRRPASVSPDGADPDTTNGDRAARRRALNDLEAQANLTLARLQHEESRVRELEDAAELEKRTAAYIDAGLSATIARETAEAEVRAERAATNAEAQRGYELSLLQDQIDLARIGNNIALAESLSDQLEITRRTREIVDAIAISEEEAASRASAYVEARREAINLDREHQLELRDLETQLQAAQSRGDDAAVRAIQRRLELEERIAELKRLGLGEDIAAERAQSEVDALERADLQGKFREWFTGGVTAALDGDLDDFVSDWWQERTAEGLTNALNDVADIVFDMFSGVLTNVIRGGEEGLGQAIGSIFSGTALPGFGGGMIEMNKGALEAADALGTVLAASASDAAINLAQSGAAAAASAAKDALGTTSKATLISAEGLAAKSAIVLANALRTAAAAADGGGQKSNLFSTLASSLFGGSNSFGFPFGGGRAIGGSMNAGWAYNVHKDETIVPNIPSFAIPKGGFGGGVTVVQNDNRTVHFKGTSEEFAQLQAAFAADREARYTETVSIMNDSVRRRKALRF